MGLFKDLWVHEGDHLSIQPKHPTTKPSTEIHEAIPNTREKQTKNEVD